MAPTPEREFRDVPALVPGGMEVAGLVTRTRDERDGPVVRIALTERGQALRADLPALLDGIAVRALRGLAATERAQPVVLLRRVAGNLDVAPGPAS